MKKTVLLFLEYLLVVLAAIYGLALIESPAGASYCYTPSYGYSGYSSYASYAYPTYYYPQYVAQPVASYVGIPIPIFGSVYVGPNGATQTTTQTTTRTATAVSTTGTAATTTTGAATVAVSADTQQILAGLKTLTGLVGQIAQKQEAHDARLLAMEQKHAELLRRFTLAEAKVNGVPGPVAPPPVPAPPAKKDAAAIPQVWVNSCAACHMRGKEANGGGFVLLENATTRAALTGRQAQKLLKHLVAATMPPKDNVHKIPPLTNEQQSAAIEDVPNFPLKKE